MSLILPMNSCVLSFEPDFFSRDPIGFDVTALAATLSARVEAIAQTLQTISVKDDAATPDTQQSLVVKAGLLQDGVSTLISDAATAAIGGAGLNRLQGFFQLQAGWDGPSSKPLDLSSIETFSNFFSRTRLRPPRLGVFMSAQGNLVANWPDNNNKLIELEFRSTEIDYFFEHSGEEGMVVYGEIGINSLLDKLPAEHAVA